MKGDALEGFTFWVSSFWSRIRIVSGGGNSCQCLLGCSLVVLYGGTVYCIQPALSNLAIALLHYLLIADTVIPPRESRGLSPFCF